MIFYKTFCCDEKWYYVDDRKLLASTLESVGEEGHCVYFASVQDLRGSKKVGGEINKNDESSLRHGTWLSSTKRMRGRRLS